MAFSVRDTKTTPPAEPRRHQYDPISSTVRVQLPWIMKPNNVLGSTASKAEESPTKPEQNTEQLQTVTGDR